MLIVFFFLCNSHEYSVYDVDDGNLFGVYQICVKLNFRSRVDGDNTRGLVSLPRSQVRLSLITFLRYPDTVQRARRCDFELDVDQRGRSLPRRS